MLRTDGERLRSGVYVAADSGRVAWRVGTTVPADLVDHYGGAAQYRRTPRRILLALFRWLVAPPLHIVRSGRRTGPTVFAVQWEGESLVFDLEDRRVIRPVAGCWDPGIYTSLRSAYAEHLCVPPFEIDADGSAVVESYLPGIRMSDLSDDVKVGLARILIDQLAALVAAEKSGSSQAIFEEIVGSVDIDVLEQAFDIELDIDEVVADARSWPLVPSQDDLVPRNVLLVDGWPTVIDWAVDRVGLRPFWYDAMTLLLAGGVHRKADPTNTLRRGYFSGDFDDAISRLFRCAAGSSAARQPDRHSLFVYWSLVNSYYWSVQRGGRPMAELKWTNARFASSSVIT